MAKWEHMTGKDVAKKWNERFNGAYETWKAGVSNVKDNPCQKAADSSSKWLQKVSLAEDKYTKGLENVSLDEWQGACKDVTPYAWNIQANSQTMTKMNSFFTKLISKLESVIPTIRDMPSTSPGEMRDRMLAYFDSMSGWDPEM